MVGGGDPFYLKSRFSMHNVRSLGVAKRPCDCSYSIFASSASAVTASEKKFN